MKAMFKIIFIFTFLTTFNAYAESPFNTLDNSHGLITGDSFEVTNLPPIKSQDGIGLCYGFSATTLLENYRCQSLNISCQDKTQLLSPVDVSSFFKNPNNSSIRSVTEGGNTSTVLDNIHRSDRKIASEDCANYPALVHQFFDSPGSQLNEKQGWNLLIDKWNEYRESLQKTSKDCISCVANEIKFNLENLETSINQVEDALKSARTAEEFLYQTIIPKECLQEDKKLSIPAFEVYIYPGREKNPTAKTLSDKIETILLNNIPVEISACVGQYKGGKCDTSHSFVLSGIKESCEKKAKNNCHTLVKVQNSLGQSWQDLNNDGWVDLETLSLASAKLSEYQQISWIQKPGSKLENKKLLKNLTAEKIQPKKIFSPSTDFIKPAEYENHKGKWKCQDGYFDDYKPNCVPFIIRH